MNTTNLRRPGDPLWLTHSADVSYTNDVAEIEIPVPTTENVMIVGMEFSAAAGRGESHVIQSFRQDDAYELNRILASSEDDGPPLAAIAKANSGLIGASAGDGLLGGYGTRQRWQGDGEQMLAILEACAMRAAMTPGVPNQGSYEVHRASLIRQAESLDPNLAFSGFIVGDTSGAKITLKLKRLDSNDAIQRVTLHAISLGQNLRLEATAGQHNAPFWHCLRKTGILATADVFALTRDLRLNTGNYEYLKLHGQLAAFYDASGVVQNHELYRFRATRSQDWVGPRWANQQAVDLGALCNTLGQQIEKRFRDALVDQSVVGMTISQAPLTDSTGELRIVQACTGWKPSQIASIAG